MNCAVSTPSAIPEAGSLSSPEQSIASPALQSVRASQPYEQGERWANLVQRIEDHDQSAVEELYAVVSKGFGSYLMRRLTPSAAADRLHEVVVGVIEAIQNGRVRQPQALLAFIQTIVRRRACQEIGERIADRRRLVCFEEAYGVGSLGPDPEEQFRNKERSALLRRLLNGLPGRSREILIRCYLWEQSPEQVQQEMNLTATQYRLMKSRAKARLGDNFRGMHDPRRQPQEPAAEVAGQAA